MLAIWGECQEHDPPHFVDIDTNAEGGNWPELPCDGTVDTWEIVGGCDECGYNHTGEYFTDEDHYVPEHECEDEE